jgi:predicted O-methyltransferase YrrM
VNVLEPELARHLASLEALATRLEDICSRLAAGVDNVVRKGEVADRASADGKVRGVRRFLGAAAAEPRVSTTAMQTVGSKGYDGFAVAVVTADAGEEPRPASPR